MQLFPLSRFAYQVVHRAFQKINNEWGCFGGAPKPPAIPPAPAIAPSPVPTATNPTSTLQGRQLQVSMLKYGALSTITNTGGAQGITGTGPDLYPSMNAGKSTVGQ